ncbi:MAG: AAA family ATPase, partial [Bacteroidetes bacterium]|nr:AAA family ATPase [Bacteroidota bacterium]
MVKKILTIKGIGKFSNYILSSTPSWNGELNQTTLIYGDNGIGKTTLGILLRSLKGEIDLIPRKRSFGFIGDQEAKILIDGESGIYSYTNNTWNKLYQKFEIFDIHFINENIYTGLCIDNTHKKNLFEIILGQEGVRLKQEIHEIKSKSQEIQQKIRQIELQIDQLTSKKIPPKVFLDMPQEAEIEEKQTRIQKEIKIAEQFDEILGKKKLSGCDIIELGINLGKIREVLSTSVDTISVEYLQKVDKHKHYLEMEDEAENWIQKGYESLKNNTCPFCLRSYEEPPEIILAYSQYFKTEYIKLQKSVNDIKKLVEKINIEFILSENEKTISTNIGLIEFWKNHIPMKEINHELFPEKKRMIECFEQVKALIIEKSIIPINALESTRIVELEEALNQFNQNIAEYNNVILNYNSEIDKIKSKDYPDKNALQSEFDRLGVAKIRQTEDAEKVCKQYNSELLALEVLKQLTEAKKIKLEEYTTDIFKKYRKRTNHYLKRLAPYIEIKKIESKYKGKSKEPFVEYALTISDNEIDLIDNESRPSVKFCLSEGDKNALALSFFFAKLDSDNSIEDKIIIFDDPVSSFDLNRKNATIFQLARLSGKAKQLIIMTHNIIF